MISRKFIVLILAISFIPVASFARQKSDKKDDFSAAMNDGDAALRAGKTDDAIKYYKRANKLRDNRSPEALLKLTRALSRDANYKGATDSAHKAVLCAANDQDKINGYTAAGLVLLVEFSAKADDKNRAKYAAEAEQEFREALKLSPNDDAAGEGLGEALLKQSKDAEGIAVLKEYLSTHPDSRNAGWVRKLISNPRRARENFIPDFSAPTLNGGLLSTESLRGKVLVLDFWATWCGPCVESIPEVRSFAHKFAKEPVVVISISADKNEDVWRKYVESHDMKWAQIYDGDRVIQRAFGISVYPTYLVVDPEGVLTSVVIGAGPFQPNKIESAVKTALKSLPKETAPSQSVPKGL